MAEITAKDVKKIAQLARLELARGEALALAGDMNQILAYVDTLQQLDLSGIEPDAGAGAGTPMRKDEIKPSLSVEDALAQAPVQDGVAFVVPQVVD